MKMKKLFILGAALLIAAACISLSSCKDDDDKHPAYPNPTMIVEYDVDFDDEFFEFCDISVIQTDFAGKQTVIPVPSRVDFKRQMMSETFPCTASLQVQMSLKNPLPTPTRSYYDLEAELDVEADGYIDKTEYRIMPDAKITYSTDKRVPRDRVVERIREIVDDVNSEKHVMSFDLGGKNNRIQNTEFITVNP